VKRLQLVEIEEERTLLTPAEAAARMGVTPATVRLWLWKGKMKGEKVLVPFARGEMFRYEWRVAEEDLIRPLRKATDVGQFGHAVLAFFALHRATVVELAYKCDLSVNTIVKMRRGEMPKSYTLKKVHAAYPEQIESLLALAERHREAMRRDGMEIETVQWKVLAELAAKEWPEMWGLVDETQPVSVLT